MKVDFRNSSGIINNLDIGLNGSNVLWIWGSYSSSLRFSNTGRFNVSGNVVAMLDYRDLNMKLPDGAFYSLFANSKVVNAEHLVLPKTGIP